jgi:hypothetical protein
LLEDLRALVEFAHAGSIAGAADRLFRTPSAITRQVQRLEAALGAELLDRSVKPPRLNSLGSRVLEQARDLLQRTEALYGVGLLPARFIATNHSIDPVKVLRRPSFDLHRSVAIVRVGQLGALGKAVELLAHGLRQLFEAADTPKPMTRHRRGRVRRDRPGSARTSHPVFQRLSEGPTHRRSKPQ